MKFICKRFNTTILFFSIFFCFFYLSPLAVAQHKTVVIPLFLDSQSNTIPTEQKYSPRDYGSPPDNCVWTYKGYYRGEYADPLIEVTYTYTEDKEKGTNRWRYFDPKGVVLSDTLHEFERFSDGYRETGYKDLTNGGYSVYDHPISGLLPPVKLGKGESWGQGWIEKFYDSTDQFLGVSTNAVTYTLLYFEDIEFDNVLYKDCLVMARNEGFRNTISWYAKGIGNIKRIYTSQGNNRPYAFELKSRICN